MACGAFRKHYKEFAYAFINDILSYPKARWEFLLFFFQNFHKHKNEPISEHSSAALFVLALSDSVHLEDQMQQIATFCSKELVSIIFNKGSDLLLRFRAIWITETFINFLPKAEVYGL